jgi:hypothetical protein
MKARIVKPQFWQDAQVAKWSAEYRLLYIGLWMLADDTGMLRYDPAAIAAELQPFRSVAVRERGVLTALNFLRDTGKFVVLDCGRHAIVPAVAEHPMGGRPTDYVRRDHEHRCRGKK